MTIVSKRSVGFTSISLYKRHEPHAFTYLSERATFWIAVLSVFAFVTGNMVGQHGWHVFWKSVMGEGSDATIVFTGTVPPIARVPDVERWARLGGDMRIHTYRQVPQDLLIPLPPFPFTGPAADGDSTELKRVYFVRHLGTYKNGRGAGSHPGYDIAVPEGTPVQSVANGIVSRVGFDAGGFGHFVVIRHPNAPDPSSPGRTTTLHSVYGHLSAATVVEEQVVQKGGQIGLSGSTGFATGPHLHFQIDRDEAPWHPYWPFTTAEARQAGMNFMQAIDSGLHRERGVQFTLDPLRFIQAHQQYVAPVVARDASSSRLSSSPKRPTTIADRRALRLAKRGIETVLVAAADPLPPPVATSPVEPSSSSSSSSVPPTGAAPARGAVASVRISHDGAYGGARGWEKVNVMLLDADGRIVVSPSFRDSLHLRTAFGRAEFKPAALSAADFRNGVATIEMLPLGEQTVVIQVEPIGTLAPPMKFVR